MKKPDLAGLDHIVLRVTDIERMLRFYQDVLGCVLERTEESIGLWQLRAGASLIDLVTVSGRLGRAGGRAPQAEGRNLDHFALTVRGTTVEDLARYLESNDIEIAESGTRYGATGFGESCYFADPEGNTIELKILS